ncbi:23S rRNA (uracil-C(5))-methyltransferase RlmCD [Clostridia bacterium]|nr:23S rRNA (uracil-C(5))-methyltransferase RlmCD [Clostridia bacterium]
MKKDDIVEIYIEDMATGGEGIGKADGFALFVKDAVAGDLVKAKVVKVKKQYGYGRLLEIIEASPYRVEAACLVHKQCGGCQLQAMSYERQLVYKKDLVTNNLRRIGGFTEFEPEQVLGMEEVQAKENNAKGEEGIGERTIFRYRNKAQFPIGRDKEGNIVAGFYAGRSHRLIPVDDCLLGRAVNQEILSIVIRFMETHGIEPYDEGKHTGLVRHVLIRQGFATGELMVCLVINGRSLPRQEGLVKDLQKVDHMTSVSLNVNEAHTNVILGQEVLPLWGNDTITDTIGNLKFRISPLSFYQVNPVQTKRLYDTVLEYALLTGNETVWDLYCGIGTISLFLAKNAKVVYGVEVIPAAIEDAKRNAQENGIENVRFLLGKAEEVLPRFYERGIGKKKAEKSVFEGKAEEVLSVSNTPDVIVTDPPRKGCDVKCLETIVKMQPKRVVYVSCDSATLARDLRYLCEHGYKLVKGRVCDMFPMTVHVECVALMSRV